ncbi:MAG: hypothetical protein ACU0FT_04150 [Paracoccus sp. (in: a-proteobacteria)]|uniref:hypothetical protein n=1 Tax=Paracoccus sp. TaxID=267 RepID=UPI004059832B
MAKKTEVDADKLRELVNTIETGKHRFVDLCARLSAEEGMKLTKIRSGGGGSKCQMAGITAGSTAGDHGAVMNWAAAARRKLLELDAQATAETETE